MMNEEIVKYQKALLVSKDFAEPHSNIGYVYTEKGELDKAMTELEEAIRLQPDHSNAHKNLGMFYFAKGDKLLAREHLIQMLKHDPNYLKGHGVFEAALELGLMKKQ